MTDRDDEASDSSSDESLEPGVAAALAALPEVFIPNKVVSQFLKQFKLLKTHDPKRLETISGIASRGVYNASHECKHCKELVYLSRKKGSYDTNKARAHLVKCNEGGKDSIQHKLNEEAMKKEVKHNNLVVNIRNTSTHEGLMELKQEAEQRFEGNGGGIIAPIDTTVGPNPFDAPSYSDKAYFWQARAFLYCTSSPPFSLYRDPIYRKMLEHLIPNEPGFKQVKNPPILTIEHLKRYIDAEFDLFKEDLIAELKPLVQESRGRPFSMIIHDAVTLSNKSKYYSIGLQFTDRSFDCNHVIALSFGKVTTTTASSLAPHIQQIVHDMTGMNLSAIVASSIQDCAALNVATELDLYQDKCTMHQGDKIGKSAIGELLRTKNREQVNPFPAGMDLVSKLREQAKVLTSKISNRSLYAAFLKANPDLPERILKLDLNGTRVSSVYELMKSSLFLRKALDRFFVENDINSFLTHEDWDFCREVEGVLRLQKQLTTHSQNEKKLNSAYGPILKQRTRKGLTADHIELIDTPSWKKYKNAPRVPVDVNVMTQNGRECRNRAILETERRFFLNNSKDTFEEQGLPADDIQKRVEMSDREIGTLLLDPRTSLDPELLDAAGWNKAMKIVCQEYAAIFLADKTEERRRARDGESDEDEDEEMQEPCPSPLKRRKIAIGELNVARRASAVDRVNNQNRNVRNRTAEEWIEIDKEAGVTDFKRALQNWTEWEPDWKKLFPKVEFSQDLDVMTELKDIDMKILLKEATCVNQEDNCFGYLLVMCKASQIFVL